MYLIPTRDHSALRGACTFSIFLSLFAGLMWAQGSTSVLTFGAKPDGIMRMDGAMTVNSAVLTSPSGSFTSSDVGKYIQVIGAGPGGTSHTDGSIQAGSAALTSPSASFASSDVGRGMVVVGAGASGGNLVTTIQAYVSPTSVSLNAPAQTAASNASYFYGAMTLESTIKSVQSSSAVTLSSPAISTISGATFAYGTDNHVAFQTAVDSTGAAGGGQVNVPEPTTCPSAAICGYVIIATDQMTAQAPGAVKIRYNNVSLVGSSPQTNLFCRGAFGVYTNSVAFPGVTGNIRGFCLTIGDNGGPNGAAGEAVSNATIANLHLYGMTNGNTFNVNFAYPPTTPTGDGWDITHKGIYMWDNSAFSNITINSVVIQDFKAENIYSGGSVITGMVIENSTLTNYNGNGISMLAADLQVLNNTISNGSNAAVENSTESTGATALIRQLYQGNTISQMPREGIVVVGVDGGVAGSVQIVNNTFDTIAQINPSGTESAIYIASQNNYVPPANVTVTGNTCHDCNSFGVFQTSGNTLIQGNTFTVDRYNAASVFGFTYPITNTTITNNTGSVTAQAQSSNLSVGAVYVINPGYASGGFAWQNVIISGNTWTFPGAPQYEFVTASGLGWGLVTLDNLRWEGDTCNGCTHSDVNHGLVNLANTTTIEPFGPTVYVSGNASAVTATVDKGKEENGAQVQIVNAGSNPVTFVSDNNLSLTSPYTLPGGGSASLALVYSAAAGKFILANPTTSITASGGTPQSATVNTAFSTPLQATVLNAGNSPVSGATVTFTAPSSGAGASFSGSSTATALTSSNGVATAPALTANGQAGSYSVTASVAGATANAAFSLTNNAPAVVSAGGALTGAGTSSNAPVSLTAAGTTDWVHWGDSSLIRKAGVTPQIGNYAIVGSGPILTYNNDPRSLNWSDGTPTLTGADNNGVYVNFLQNGFSFTAPADTNQRTLTVYVGGWLSGGTFTAHLSDGSAPNFTDVTTPAGGQYDRNYTLTYNAASAGQTLTVSWVATSGSGNVTLNGVALAQAAGTLSISATAGTPQSSMIDTSFATPLQATVLNTNKTPAAGVTVTFTTPSSGAGASFNGSSTATALTNSSGIATAPALTANGEIGGYTVTAGVNGAASSAIFGLSNIAGTPTSISATAGTPQNTTVNTAFATPLQVTVKDAGGNLLGGVTVTFTASSSGAGASFGGSGTATAVTGSNGVATAPALTANGQAGSYSVTAAVVGIAIPADFSLTNAAASTGGSGTLTGIGNSSSNTVNLTTEGTFDWIHFGDALLNRKATGNALISTYQIIGSGPVTTYANDPRPMSWTDGSPTATSSNNADGLYIDFIGNGFSFTAPAGTTVHTLTVHVGGWFSGATITAHLSDGSAADYVDSTTPVNSQYDRNYTFTYNAASAGQTLTITWVDTSGGGNVTLNGAALQ